MHLYRCFSSFISISLLFSCIFTASAKTLPGYQDTGINTIKMHVRTHSLISNVSKEVQTNPSTVNPKAANAHCWETILIDVANNRTAQRIFEGAEKPAFSANPQLETFSIDGKITSINHSRKQAFIKKADSNDMSSLSMIYAGRTHNGNSLAQIINEASKTGKIIKQNNIFILKIGAPYFTPPQYREPITLELNSLYLPIKLIEQNRTFTYDWKQNKPDHHWYVNHAIMTLKKGDNLMKYVQWIDQIEINAPILDQAFEFTIPPTYKVHDMSKRLRSPF